MVINESGEVVERGGEFEKKPGDIGVLMGKYCYDYNCTLRMGKKGRSFMLKMKRVFFHQLDLFWYIRLTSKFFKFREEKYNSFFRSFSFRKL